MRTAGIICEYNPFHLGHQHQLLETRRMLGKDLGIVCLMSGNYVQRGEPAAYPKGIRAEAAIRGGADLVLELPLTVAVNASGYFASGAVTCLSKLGCMDVLSFGSECGDLDALSAVARALDSESFELALQQELKSGCSYAAARTRALGPRGALLESPNNALGIEYLRALFSLQSPIVPMTIPRDFDYPSASDIRASLGSGIPNRALPFSDLYEGAPLHTLKNGERAMLAILRTLPDEAFEAMAFESEGLFSKVMKESRRRASIEEIMMSCKSKRYALSRLRRTLLCLCLGLTASQMALSPPYLRVLAFNDRGRAILRRMNKTSSLPLISGNIPRTPEAEAYFRLESRAADLYGLFAPDTALEPPGSEKAWIPRYIKLEQH